MVLGPEDRRLATDCLRPPDGYGLDQAIGTTFTLDLLAVIAAPLAFARFDRERGVAAAEGSQGLASLEALRRYADRITVFCQKGHISVPRSHERFFAYLEQSIVEVPAPHDLFTFQPKVWVLRYLPHDGKSAPLYRCICLSRNLTYDRSWDTVLVLDGAVGGEQEDTSGPLAELISTLPKLAGDNLQPRSRESIHLMTAELRRVHFIPPSGFERVAFHALGIGEDRWPFPERYERMLIVSPFLTDTVVRRLAARGQQHVLVSRSESLDGLAPSDVERFGRVFVLSDSATGQVVDPETARITPSVPHFGLHAKVYVADCGRRGRIWTGSANATAAAFNYNVELLVELTGSISRCGVDAVLRPGAEGGLEEILTPYFRSDTEPADDTKADRVLDAARRAICRMPLEVAICPTDSTADPGDDTFEFLLSGIERTDAALSPVDIACRPITLSAASTVNFDGAEDGAISFGPVRLEELTSFFAFTVCLRAGADQDRMSFVLNLRVSGLPEGRQEALLRTLIRNRRQPLHFLLLLVSEDGADISAALERADAEGGESDSDATESQTGIPVLEALLKALAQDARRLDWAVRLVEDLRRGSSPGVWLPPDVDRIWGAIKATYEARRADQ